VTNYRTWLEDFGGKLAENRQRVAAFILSGFIFRNDQPHESLTTNREVPGSIPGSTVGVFPEGGFPQ